MTKTAEIIASVETAGSDIADTSSRAHAALECATDLAESAAAHGWEGVASSMQAAVDDLETTIASLGGAEQATDAAVSTLRGITDQMSSPEVVERLGAAHAALGEAATALDGATDTADEAWQAAQRAGEPSQLMQHLQGVCDGLDDARRAVAAAAEAVDAERQDASAWGK